MSLPGARRRCGRVWTHDNAPNLRGGHRGHPSMWSRHVTDERIVRCLADQVTVNLRAGVGRTDRRFVQRLGAPVRNAPWYDRQGEQERVQDRRGYPRNSSWKLLAIWARRLGYRSMPSHTTMAEGTRTITSRVSLAIADRSQRADASAGAKTMAADARVRKMYRERPCHRFAAAHVLSWRRFAESLGSLWITDRIAA